MSKVEKIAGWLRDQARQAAPGAHLASVASLGDAFSASTGTVLAGVDLAGKRGVKLERRRGPQGGYFVPEAKRARQKERWVKLSFQDSLSDEAYADLAHVLWCAAKVALPAGGFTVTHDGVNTSRDLQARWVALGRDIPWQN